MRKWINALTEDETKGIEYALGRLGSFIKHNVQGVDHHEIATILRAHGYIEPIQSNIFYRAMYHNCENDSRTIGEFYNTIKDEQLMQMLSLVSCCVRPEDALNFITRTIHTVNYDGRIWPEHRFDTLLDPLKEVWVLYKIHCKLNSVLWSMEGLDHFASSHRKYRTTIDDILYDYESDRIRYYAIR